MTPKSQCFAALCTALLLAASQAQAQQANPFQQQNTNGITSPQSRAANGAMLTTKPVAADGVGLPWHDPAPVAVTPPGAQAQPQPIPTRPSLAGTPSPFGKSTASQYQPIPAGPHTATAVPVENIDMIEASEPAPAVARPLEADPANEDPAAPTEYSAPIFESQDTQIPRMAVVKVLNKVTARAQQVNIKPTEKVTVGKLELMASHCQLSAENSLPDAAALLRISETVPDAEKPKLLFSGWMYKSSPSVSALEHPVYDVTLLECRDTVPPKPEAKPKKK